MKFSVLVPVYNVEKYIEQCLNSILEQTFQNFEIIIVDDGSTDRSGEICDKYKLLYPDQIKVIHKTNQGLISARRVGIDYAEGEFCIFVDSDDFVAVDLMENIDTYLNTDEEVDVLLYSFSYYKNGILEQRKKKIAKDYKVWTGDKKQELYEMLCCTTDITTLWTKAIRTSILKEDCTVYSNYYGKNMAEDLLQSLYPITKAKKVMYMDKALYRYRINDESISHSVRIETLDGKNTLHVYDKLVEYLSLWGMDKSDLLNKVQARWLNDAMYLFVKYYKAASTRAEKDALIFYDWDSWLPRSLDYKHNTYINSCYYRIYTLQKKKRRCKLDIYLFYISLKERVKHFIRKIKKGC